MSQLRFILLQPVTPTERNTATYMNLQLEERVRVRKVSFNDKISVVPTYAAYDELATLRAKREAKLNPKLSLNFKKSLRTDEEGVFDAIYDRRCEDSFAEWNTPDKLTIVWKEIYALRKELFPSGTCFGNQQLDNHTVICT